MSTVLRVSEVFFNGSASTIGAEVEFFQSTIATFSLMNKKLGTLIMVLKTKLLSSLSTTNKNV